MPVPPKDIPVFPPAIAAAAVVVLVLLLQACAGLRAGDPETLRPRNKTSVDNTFGFDIHDPVRHWPSQPFGWWRMWDANVDWARVEPAAGVFDFSLLDQYVALAAQHNVKIIYVLGNTPAWASTDPTHVGTEGVAGGTAPPVQLQDWQSFVQAVATRYKGRIAAYEVWNEANLNGYWTGSVSEMMQLVQSAYATIKHADPAATVLAPSVVAGSGLDWLSQFLSSGGNAVTDAIAYHLYDTAKLPEQAVSFDQQVLAIAQQWGKDVWDTEVGWGPWGTFDERESAAFLARTFILQTAQGVTHIVWYAWDDRGPWVHLFLLESDLQTPTLAAMAFGQVQTWLEGSMTTCSSQSDDTWECTLTTSDGKLKYVVWNSAGAQSFSIPSSWNVGHVTDLQGNSHKLAGGQLNIDPSPVLLTP